MKKDFQKEHLKFALHRGLNKTYCPSEVARSLCGLSWRKYMKITREIADNLVREGKLEVFQKNVKQQALPSRLKGPIRLRISPVYYKNLNQEHT
ncbi:hypothetical protein GCM10022393_42100 [Aquimarina addita]|uniref:DUF3253 domain-containing protein n=1 Tax=Aquimarina addita TaxID=870485 RepID=A0ABP6UUR0_9FLAO